MRPDLVSSPRRQTRSPNRPDGPNQPDGPNRNRAAAPSVRSAPGPADGPSGEDPVTLLPSEPNVLPKVRAGGSAALTLGRSLLDVRRMAFGPGRRAGDRDTVGWSGVPEPTPPPGRSHLALIHRGLEIMGVYRRAELRRRIDRMVGGSGNLNEARIDHIARLGEASIAVAHASARRDHERLAAAEMEYADAGVRLASLDEMILTQKRLDRDRAMEVMEDLRSSLAGRRSVAEAVALLDLATFEPELEPDEGMVRAAVVDYLRLGRTVFDPRRLRLTTSGAERSSMDAAGTLDLAPDADRAEIFHELGHFTELSDPVLYQAAVDWRTARGIRSFGREIISPLLELVPELDYGPDETAVRDQFFTEYVGAVYDDDSGASTEVFSTGVERFDDPASMLDLYRVDPEHFLFILGALDQ